MRLLLAVVVALAALGAVALLPRAPDARLAALEAGELLTEGEEPLADRLAPIGPEGTARVRLGAVRVAGADDDPRAAELARRTVVLALRARGPVEVEGERAPVAGGAQLTVRPGDGSLALTLEDAAGRADVGRSWHPPGRAGLVPPLVAIAVAVALRRPLVALFVGVLAGAFLVRRAEGAGPSVALLGALPDVPFRWLWAELTDTERTYIIGFVIFMLLLVGVLVRTGGIRGVMDRVARLAGTTRSTQVAAFLMGLVVFFDDYANTLLVGSTMRPLTDRLRIAREKLAYLVDSTAAPVAGLSIFSTWIAFEVSTYSNQLPSAGLSPSDGYAVFLETLPYRFYCLFTLVFVGLVAATGRDWGPMLTAEVRARTRGELVRPGGVPLVGSRATDLEPSPHVQPRAWRAVVPLAVFVGGTLLLILHAGGAFSPEVDFLTLEGATQVLYDGSGSRPLLLGSGLALLVGLLLALLAGVLGEALGAAWSTLRSMFVAIAILYLAWMIGAVCTELGTAEYLTVLLADRLEPGLLPGLLFLLAGVVAFSTGSSWSTMSILLPLVVGLAFGLGEGTSIGGHALMVLSIGAVLEGAIFGDHCSPISDTTVMSSIACASDHVDHVRTQAPYALLTMSVALGLGYLPCALLGWSPWIPLALGPLVLFAVLRMVGRRAPAESARA